MAVTLRCGGQFRKTPARDSAITDNSLRYCAFALLAVLAACGERAAKQAVAERFPAGSTKLQGVARHGDAVCGEVNATGSTGTSGYRRFIYDDRTDEVTVAQDVTYETTDLAAFDASCRMAGGQAGAAALCEEAGRVRRAVEDGRRFEQDWRRRCVSD